VFLDEADHRVEDHDSEYDQWRLQLAAHRIRNDGRGDEDEDEDVAELGEESAPRRSTWGFGQDVGPVTGATCLDIGTRQADQWVDAEPGGDDDTIDAVRLLIGRRVSV
jgi:hypothetical protein